jgi:hypothetical protein
MDPCLETLKIGHPCGSHVQELAPATRANPGCFLQKPTTFRDFKQDYTSNIATLETDICVEIAHQAKDNLKVQ